jgi:hypothetical protein
LVNLKLRSLPLFPCFLAKSNFWELVFAITIYLEEGKVEATGSTSIHSEKPDKIEDMR